VRPCFLQVPNKTYGGAGCTYVMSTGVPLSDQCQDLLTLLEWGGWQTQMGGMADSNGGMANTSTGSELSIDVYIFTCNELISIRNVTRNIWVVETETHFELFTGHSYLARLKPLLS